jgi:hypothetical protein
VAGGFVVWMVDSTVEGLGAIFWRFANGMSQDRMTVLTINGEVVVDEWLFRSARGSWSLLDVAGLTVRLAARSQHDPADREHARRRAELRAAHRRVPAPR